MYMDWHLLCPVVLNIPIGPLDLMHGRLPHERV